jgi:hypothetical protein
VRPIVCCFLMIFACIDLAGCAYGSDADGYGLLASIDSGVNPSSSNGDGGEVADSTLPNADSSSRSDTNPFDSSVDPFDSSVDPFDSSDDAFSEDADAFDSSPPPSDGSSPTCTLTFSTGNASCDSCTAMYCCFQDMACGSDPTCVAYGACLKACQADSGDTDAAGLTACFDACDAEYPSGATAMDGLASCLECVGCSTSCTIL